MRTHEPNQSDPPNVAFALRFQAERPRRAVGDPVRWASSKTMRTFASLFVCLLSLLCGCGRNGYKSGVGDAGQFILQRALTFGGRAIATNGLPTIPGGWRYVEDEFGVNVLFPVSQFSAVDAYLRSAFGPSSSHVGWSVRDVRIAIYLQRVGSNTQVGILRPMTEAQMERAGQKLKEAIERNTR